MARHAPGRRHVRRGAATELAVRDAVAWITLARPETRNRLEPELLAGLVEACAAAEAAEEVRVVVLAAAGTHFCAGLPESCSWPPAEWPDGVGAVARLTKPVIACVAGEVRGWGVALALACDLRIAASTAVLRLPEAARGRLPGGGVTQRLARLVGPARALELVLLGEPLPATRAAAWGLLSCVVAPGRLHVTAVAMAGTLAARGPLALRLAKEAVTRAFDLPLDDGLRLEHDLYVLLQTTADRREGVRAFVGRRKPRFRGR